LRRRIGLTKYDGPLCRHVDEKLCSGFENGGKILSGNQSAEGRDIPRSFRSPNPQVALSTACDLLFSNLSTTAKYVLIPGNRDCFSAPFAVREHQANRTVPHRSERIGKRESPLDSLTTMAALTHKYY
jgi:hypothetical protein